MVTGRGNAWRQLVLEIMNCWVSIGAPELYHENALIQIGNRTRQKMFCCREMKYGIEHIYLKHFS